jgi:DNA-binding beta-propeller fold protein YncE
MTIRNVTLGLCLALTALLGCDLFGHEKTCPSDQRLCGGTCKAVNTDRANCGGCGVNCGAGGTCDAGACQCAPDTQSCNQGCANFASSRKNCGTCGHACLPTEVCSLSACADHCADGLTSCEGDCVDFQSSWSNCGACGRPCESGETCLQGLCTADLYLACYSSNEIQEATADLKKAGLPRSTDTGPVRLAWLNQILFAANSSSNTISRLLRDPPGTRLVHGDDAFKILSQGGWIDLEYLAAYQGLLYVSNASFGTLFVVRPDGTRIDEIPLARQTTDSTDPLGVDFLPGSDGGPGKAYVALNGSDQLAVIPLAGDVVCAAPPCARPATWIDLQPLASPGGHARPARVLVRGSRIFVTLWNVDESWKPVGTGRIAVIDAATDTLDASVSPGGQVGLLDLGNGCLNPYEMTLLNDTLYVTCGTSTPPISGASIVPIDLSGATPQIGTPLPGPDGAAPGKLTFCHGQGYLSDRLSGLVYRFDAMTGKTSGASELCPVNDNWAWTADIVCGH